MAEFLLEIGCEELPAPWLPGLGDQLARALTDAAAAVRLEPGGVKALWTPRRLVAVAEVRAGQQDREEHVWGPSLKLAKDAAGSWTKAAEGFARKNGVSVGDLIVAFRGAGGPMPSAGPTAEAQLLHVRKVSGRPASEILPGVIAAVLRALAFPKRMSWDAWLEDGKAAFPFGRPIRWLLALLDGAVVPFEIHALANGARGGVVVRAGAVSYGHRFLPRGGPGGPVRVTGFTDLVARLRESFVLLDPAERRARIEAGLERLRAQHTIPGWEHLKDEWVDLTEHPTVVSGRIPAAFAELPLEVRDTVLGHHQKYIPLLARGSRALGFAAVTNTDDANSAQIARGMERVVVARLRDAAFFFREDMKRPLAERVADLAGVSFHQKLGSYAEKAARMTRLVDELGAGMGALTRPEHEAAREAARLAKADLTTLMVREFTELQGVMGGIYLRAQGHPWANVALAVQWHYHPLAVDEASPPAGNLSGSDATVFAAVSLADKIDTLAGYFGLGLAPSGSSDPYGLRRAAQGAVRVLLDFWEAADGERRPSLRRLAAHAIAGYAERLPRAAAEVAPELEAFLLERVRYVLVARGFPGDEVDAVLGAREPEPLDDPRECLVRLRALHRVRQEAREDFEHLAVAFKRARNILGQGQPAPVDPGLFQEPAERELHAAVGRMRARNGGYEASLRSLAALRAPVDRFFEDVLVMAEDPKLRGNRLGLLEQTLSLFYRVADVSKLGGQA